MSPRGRADEIRCGLGAEGDFFQMQTLSQALIDHVLSARRSEVAANRVSKKPPPTSSSRSEGGQSASLRGRGMPRRSGRKHRLEPERGRADDYTGSPEERPGLVVPADERMMRARSVSLVLVVTRARTLRTRHVPPSSRMPPRIPGTDAEPVRSSVGLRYRRRPNPASSSVSEPSRPWRRRRLVRIPCRCWGSLVKQDRVETGAATWVELRPALIGWCSSCRARAALGVDAERRRISRSVESDRTRSTPPARYGRGGWHH